MKTFIYTVTQINNYTKTILENKFQNIWIKGEISSFNYSRSGHAYFILKDDKSEISCTLFNYKESHNLANGLSITINGNITIYNTKGKYQVIVKDFFIDGDGQFWVALNTLKEKLLKEGLFEKKYKKNIPKYPFNIGIITSISGSVLQDMINIYSRRSKYLNLFVKDTNVQGDVSVEMLCDSIDELNLYKSIDLIVIARGGGSFEDLNCFNNEKVVRSIFNSKKPIISAIGHETDFTLCDFVADLRASTPSEACELSSVSTLELKQNINNMLERFNNRIINQINDKINVINYMSLENNKQKNIELINIQINKIKDSYKRMNYTINYIIDKENIKIDNYLKLLKKNNIKSLKKIGFSIIRKSNNIINNIQKLNIDDEISIDLHKGNIKAFVKEINEN